MQPLIDYARTFRHQTAARPEEFARLAEGQAPQALFITCSDSRVIPSLITGARPGELFELRTAGNIVPPYGSGQPSGEAATIEYAVEVLGVTDVVVCGHSHCGAVGALVRGDDLNAVPAVRDWLAHTAPRQDGTKSQDDPAVADAVQSHVLAQILRLRSYPCVARRLDAGELRLHAWFYEIHTGTVLAHEPHADTFVAL
ncbi:carbonic anhydrase [Streptomyces prasinosporus]|uniref:Carbonic anhydrase n=2 Tax=Streptomyces TaxID=1883 RepID=A0ABP6U3K8_9ACTN|nr:carbonic anhydrase [Streptomyces tricolor]MCG0062173.1 carbonic anhydrase [Streptomyces tricolor]GHC14114.1 carbonic anhydrase [Streptomyces albogriseolus]